MIVESYEDAKKQFLSVDFSCESYFEKNVYILEFGYCKFLQGDIDEAKKIFKLINERDFRADWALKLIQFIERFVSVAPSYFQIRNFLEIDLHLLIKAGQAEYVENIINGADIFFSVNPESYKFIARVMQYNGFDDLTMHFLKKAKDRFYYDPEMHFMLGTCYKNMNEPDKAKDAFNTCLSILPNYFPAKDLLDEMSKK